METLLVLHVLASAVVGWAGRNRRFGFAGFFLLSLVLSPLVMILLLLITGSTAAERESTRRTSNE